MILSGIALYYGDNYIILEFKTEVTVIVIFPAYHFTDQQLDSSSHDSQCHHRQSPEHKHVVKVALQRKHTDPGPTRQHPRIKYKRRSVPTPKDQADVSSLVHEPWYHGDISWEDAEERLETQDSDCFLVRKSQSQPGEYVLSVSFGGVIKHYPICVQNQCCEIEGTETPFKSLDELIVYYKSKYISTQEDVLTTPCIRPTLTPCKKQPPPMVEGCDVM